MDISGCSVIFKRFFDETDRQADSLKSRFRRYVRLFGHDGAFRLYTKTAEGNIRWYMEIYGGALFVVIYGDRNDRIPEDISAAFAEWFNRGPLIWGCRELTVQYRTKTDAVIIFRDDNTEPEITIRENGSRYLCSLSRGQNPGIFLDARNAREFIRLHSSGKRILNLFAYTCAFSVAAMQGGAGEVINVDMKMTFLRWGIENHRLNRIHERGVRFEKLNVMKSFGRFERFGPYDMVICDPPPAQGKNFSGKKDFPRLIRRCSSLVRPGGLLIVLVNDKNAGEGYAWKLLQNVNSSAHGSAGRPVRFSPLVSVLPCEDFACDETGTVTSVFIRVT